jgi:hypothetical protein
MSQGPVPPLATLPELELVALDVPPLPLDVFEPPTFDVEFEPEVTKLWLDSEPLVPVDPDALLDPVPDAVVEPEAPFELEADDPAVLEEEPREFSPLEPQAQSVAVAATTVKKLRVLI